MLCQYSREEAKSYISGNSEQEAIQEQWPEAYRRRYNVITYYIVINHAGCVYNQKPDKIRGEELPIINPIIYPKLGLRRYPNPPPSANIGSPISPRIA